MARERIVIWTLFFMIAAFNVYCTTIDLKGKWSIHNANGSINVYGNVPGSVHMSLLENGVIQEPYFRFNDVNYRWIAYDNWTYTRTFTGKCLCVFSFCGVFFGHVNGMQWNFTLSFFISFTQHFYSFTQNFFIFNSLFEITSIPIIGSWWTR